MGTLVHSVDISGSRLDVNSANDSDVDSDPVVVQADLSVTVDDLEVTALPGDLRIYTLVAANSGPSHVDGVLVVDQFPAELQACTWTCARQGPGSGCTVGPIDGDVVDSVRLAAEGSVIFTAGCIVDPALDPNTATVINSASILVPAGVQDGNLANNAAQDVNAGPAQVISRDGFESGDLSGWSSFLPQP